MQIYEVRCPMSWRSRGYKVQNRFGRMSVEIN